MDVAKEAPVTLALNARRINGGKKMSGSKSLLSVSLVAITAVGAWGVASPSSMVSVADRVVGQFFESRGWFVMLSVTGMLVVCVALAASPFGKIRLGLDHERPEFSTVSWIAMLFAAGMGVGLLFWAVAEPLTHFAFTRRFISDPSAADEALVATNFHWGVHAWAIYGATALAIAYFSFRRGAPMLASAPITSLFGHERWAAPIGWAADFVSIVAIAIGVGGSIAMGVFQVAGGVDVLIGGDGAGPWLVGAVLAAMIACYLPATVVDLGQGMSRLSNLAMLIAGGLILFTIIFGPTEYLLNSVMGSFGRYLFDAFPRGFQTYTFFDQGVSAYFNDWTLTYMVWWIAWGPFVGVFIARISRGRTIREFVLGVLVGPTVISVVWFGAFGGIGLYEVLEGPGALLALAQSDAERVTFALLERLPFAPVTIGATVLAAFLFIVTSVVSAAFVLGMFSTGGDSNPKPAIRALWGILLGALGVAMVLSGSIDAVKKVIALGALPFVFIAVLLQVCLIKALVQEGRRHASG